MSQHTTAPQPVQPISPVVSNTTPLITLGEIGLLDVLCQLYRVVWIPPAVDLEYQRGRAAHPQRPDLHGLSWLSVHLAPVDSQLPTSLDLGEREAIALARSVAASRILLDERLARAAATQFQLVVTGSVGVLVVAKQQGIISLVKPYLDLMRTQGRYLGMPLYELALHQAGE